MPSSFTTVLGLEIQTSGENDNTWGSKANTVFEMLEDAICESYSVVTTGGTTTLNMPDGATASSEARRAYITVSGTLASNATITVPDGTKKPYIIVSTADGSGGPYTVTFKTVSGTGVVIPDDSKCLVYADGTNVVSVFRVTDEAAPLLTATDLGNFLATNVSGLGTAAYVNTGTSSGNVPLLATSGLPAVGGASLTSLNASALSSGTVPVARLPAATATAIGAVEEATAAEVAAETDGKFPDAATLKSHPGVVVAWGAITVSGGTPTLVDSYNITSVTDLGTGHFRFNFTNNMANTNYAAIAGVGRSASTTVTIDSRATSSVTIKCWQVVDSANDPVNPSYASVVVYGTLA